MTEAELRCENCGQRLDANDKFCRECGLPTVRRAEAHIQIPSLAPDTGEMKRALDAVPEPLPFLREDPPEPAAAEPLREPLATSDVVRVTNPTFVSQLASSTALMVAVIAILVIVGVALIFLAFR